MCNNFCFSYFLTKIYFTFRVYAIHPEDINLLRTVDISDGTIVLCLIVCIDPVVPCYSEADLTAPLKENPNAALNMMQNR